MRDEAGSRSSASSAAGGDGARGERRAGEQGEHRGRCSQGFAVRSKRRKRFRRGFRRLRELQPSLRSNRRIRPPWSLLNLDASLKSKGNKDEGKGKDK